MSTISAPQTTLASASVIVAPTSTSPSLALTSNPIDAWQSYTIYDLMANATSGQWVLTQLPKFSSVVLNRTYTEVRAVIAETTINEPNVLFTAVLSWDGANPDLQHNTTGLGWPKKHSVLSNATMGWGTSSTRWELEQGESQQISPPPTTGKVPQVSWRVTGTTATSTMSLTIEYRQGGPGRTVVQGF